MTSGKILCCVEEVNSDGNDIESDRYSISSDPETDWDIEFNEEEDKGNGDELEKS